MMQSRLDLCLWWKSDDDEFGILAVNVAHFFETLGAYVKEKAVSEKIVWHVFSDPIQHYWRMLVGNIKNLRENADDGTIFENFEYLNQRMQHRGEDRAIKGTLKSEEEVNDFADIEISVIKAMRRLSAFDDENDAGQCIGPRD